MEIRILDHALPPVGAEGAAADPEKNGAELIFHGRVREREGDEPILALDYECYEGMAHKELRRLADETVERFRISDLVCLHRVGRVAAGEASLRVTIQSPHRAEALDAMAWFISEMKKRVPIWKWAVRPDGRREPT